MPTGATASGSTRYTGTIDTDMGDQVLVTWARNVGTNDIEVARRQVIGPAADRPDGTGVSVSEREV